MNKEVFILEDCNMLNNRQEFLQRANNLYNFFKSNNIEKWDINRSPDLMRQINEELHYSFNQVNMCNKYLVNQGKIKPLGLGTQIIEIL